MIWVAITMNHIKVVIRILQDKHSYGKARGREKFLALKDHNKAQYSGSRWDCQHWSSCETLLELLKAFCTLESKKT